MAARKWKQNAVFQYSSLRKREPLISSGDQGLSIETLVKLDTVGKPLPSPIDPELVVFSRKTFTTANKTSSQIYLIRNLTDSSKREIIRLTNPQEKADTSPCWTADGKKICFLSNRSGSKQLWCIDITTPGEAYRMSDLPTDIETFKVYSFLPGSQSL